MKKAMSLLTATAMAATLLAGCGGGTASSSAAPAADSTSTEASSTAAEPAADAAAEEGKVLNIWCWNDEFQSRFNDYYPGVKEIAADKSTTTLDNGVTVKWTINPNDNNNYQNKLDEALLKQDSAAADDKIDIFLIEADYALKYVDSEYTLDVKKDVGLTDDDLKDQYQYTKDIVTVDGVQKGTTWQATPGLFAYRRSIAKDVLGTDDPTEVQAALSDWDKFNDVAEKAAAKGYKMLSGYDDSYRTFSNNVSAGWVDGTTVKVDPNIMNWVDQTKTYTDNGYNNKTSLWSDQWAADQGPAGKVFGFFYSTWGINFTLLGNSLATPESEGGKQEVGNGIFGDYAVCQGPQPYYWGGTWICAAAGTDNISTIKDVMYSLTCDADIMTKITEDTQDYTNCKEGNVVLAAEECGAEVRVSCDGIHSALAVGVVLRILGDLGHDVSIAGQRVHDILDRGDVVSAGCCADPGAAPVIRLRALADCIIAEDTVADFLLASLRLRRGQRVALFAEVAPTIDMSNAGPYDQGCNETFQSCFKDYFDGTVDLETAKKNFEDQIKVKYPELSSVEWPA